MRSRYTVAEEIADVSVGKPHVVILRAGASRAAFPSGDRNGRRLPVMADIVLALGLEDVLRKAGFDPAGNFEEAYAAISLSAAHGGALDVINRRVEEYVFGLRRAEASVMHETGEPVASGVHCY